MKTSNLKKENTSRYRHTLRTSAKGVSALIFKCFRKSFIFRRILYVVGETAQRKRERKSVITDE